MTRLGWVQALCPSTMPRGTAYIASPSVHMSPHGMYHQLRRIYPNYVPSNFHGDIHHNLIGGIPTPLKNDGVRQLG